ncbi:MAG: phosphopentomutase [Elusimicrobiota bacterium]|jgi:phosphopentomutase|nr:phosphopentomutase [Elusimicrobiota bacterium]
MHKKVVLIILDSVGVGELPDAQNFNDKGANTLGHIFDYMPKSFELPNLAKLGLYKLINTKRKLEGAKICACFGKAIEKSPAKDTTAGHWEIAGIILKQSFPTYSQGFPKEIIEIFEKTTGIKTIGNCVTSGTEVIKTLGKESQKANRPIIYTSADSVFQIAAHEQTFGLEKLYEICKIARKILQGQNSVGRVIARPFVGNDGNYIRTVNRKDFSLDPFEETFLDKIKNSGAETTAIGKIEDIFNGKGITKSIHTKNNLDGMEQTLKEINSFSGKDKLIFANLVDFDMLWGHRRDVNGYAKALKDFDDFLPKIIDSLNDEDILIISADHGCDPTYILHTDHTREYIPILVFGKKLNQNVNLGTCQTFADIGQTVIDFLALTALKNGTSFKNRLTSFRDSHKFCLNL